MFQHAKVLCRVFRKLPADSFELTHRPEENAGVHRAAVFGLKTFRNAAVDA